MASEESPEDGKGNGKPNGLAKGIPNEPVRFVIWAILGFLSLLGVFFTTLNGLPWPHKAQVDQIGREITRLDRLGDSASNKAAALELSLQSMQYEARQLRERVDWLEAEIERIRAYVYPQPSYRVPRPRPPGAPDPVEPKALGPPTTKYP